MRRWMSIITLAALVLALIAGWGIGQLAGGGSDDAVIERPLATLPPTPTVVPESVSRTTPVPSSPIPAAADLASPAPISDEADSGLVAAEANTP